MVHYLNLPKGRSRETWKVVYKKWIHRDDGEYELKRSRPGLLSGLGIKKSLRVRGRSF